MADEKTSTSKFIPKLFTLEELDQADQNMEGFCIACGASRGDCEPDARYYHCGACGKNLVFGAEEILLRGHVKP